MKYSLIHLLTLALAMPLTLAGGVDPKLPVVPVIYPNTLPAQACGSGTKLNAARTQCIVTTDPKPKKPNCSGQPTCLIRKGRAPYCPPGACGPGTTCTDDPNVCCEDSQCVRDTNL
ncbi:MAG: hypothetical protein DHS80DRAFT_21018 [Piptocephalis tieghemiana]|nr:MAG: hypothetical protein DHS80DRAFT_21018 [Piptocephalis tieghemiana]